MKLTHLSALAATALLASCSAGIGDFCQTDEDCAAELRCSGDGVARGVCVLPGALPDSGPSLERALPSDSAPTETATKNDSGDDMHASDAVATDGTLVDGQTADGAAADGAADDGAADGASPEDAATTE